MGVVKGLTPVPITVIQRGPRVLTAVGIATTAFGVPVGSLEGVSRGG